MFLSMHHKNKSKDARTHNSRDKLKHIQIPNRKMKKNSKTQ